MDWSGRSGDHLTSSMLTREGNTVNALMALLSASCPQPCFRGLDERLSRTDFKRPLLPSLDVDGLGENDITDYTEQSYHTEKKRRLTVEQVRCLEKSFKVENKLEPEKKMELAQELGLQPRQVAVWFQNRRARWKSKQLEQDYDILKTEYDALLNEKQKLEAEVVSLTDKLVSKESITKSVEEDGFSSPSESESQQHVNSDIETSVESENQVDVSNDFQISGQSSEKTSNCTIKSNIDEYSPKSDGYNSDVLDLGSPCNPIHMALNHEQESAGMISLNPHKIADHTRETFAYIPLIEGPYGTVYNNSQMYEEIAYKLEDGLFYDQEYHYCNMPDDQAAFPAWWYNWP